jgi:hypothetical protein
VSDCGRRDDGAMSEDGSTPERPLESPAVPTDEIEVDPADAIEDDEHPLPAAPPGAWEADPADVADQLREVPLDDDR